MSGMRTPHRRDPIRMPGRGEPVGHGRPDRPEHLRHRDPGADVNLATHYPTGKSPLWVACDRGDLKIVNALIAAGAHANTANADGETALWVASLEGHLNVVKALVTAGANVNALDSHNIGPLLCASSNGHLEIVKILLKEGADVNAADAFGQTPLSLATRYHHTDVVRVLDLHIDSLVRSAPARVTRSRSRSATTPTS
jgi:ankyrin repeat protein